MTSLLTVESEHMQGRLEALWTSSNNQHGRLLVRMCHLLAGMYAFLDCCQTPHSNPISNFAVATPHPVVFASCPINVTTFMRFSFTLELRTALLRKRHISHCKPAFDTSMLENLLPGHVWTDLHR
jgi:hypothetical protein